MWIAIKLKKMNEKEILKKSLTKLLGEDVKFCQPKIKSNKFLNKKLISKDIYILGKYLLIYHKKFSEIEVIDKINYIRGVDYLLNGFKSCQQSIVDFVNKCENNLDNSGYINFSFFDLFKGSKVKFKNGPFTNFVSELVEIQKNKFKLNCGNITILLDKNNNNLLPTN